MHKSIATVAALMLATSMAHAADPITVSIPPGLKAITSGKAPPSHETPSFKEVVKLAPQFISTYAGGTGALIKGMFTRKFGGFNRALATATKLSDERLQKMPADVTAELAGVLLDGKMISTANTKFAANQQFLRVLTSKGRDAGHVLGTLSRLGIFNEEDVAKKLQPVAAAEFKSLMAEVAAKPGDWSSFRTFAENSTGAIAREGNGVKILVNGSTYFPALKAAIEGSEKFVLMHKFAVHSDETGAEVMGELADAAKRGVPTSLQYDAVGSIATEHSVFDAPIAAGAKVLRTPPGRPLGGSMDHRKIVVVDGKKAYVGGMNIGDEYAKTWHDIQSEITGPVVADLQKTTVDHLKQIGGKITRGLRRRLKQASEETLATPVAEMTAYAVNHTGLEDQNEKALYLRASKLSNERIWIANPYMTDDNVVEELTAAAQRGADVRIILPARNDEKLLAWGERARFQKLIDGGVEVYEYVGKDLHNPQMPHGKAALFDHSLATIGSSNLDQRSLKNNHETNIWVEGSKLNAELAEVFEQDFKVSERIVKYTPTELDKVEDKLLRKGSKEL